MRELNNDLELKRSLFRTILLASCRVARCRRLALKIALKLEGGGFYSETARRIMSRYYGLSIGTYSYGECFVPNAFPSGVSIGRYVSIGPEVRAYLRNHPTDRLSMHPFFYNHRFGFVDRDTIENGSLVIEHDVWIGARAIITPGCSRIGLGAVIGAGAVVTKDVPDFSIVAGNPARVVRIRFPDETCELIKNTRWWENSVEHCAEHLAEFIKPLSAFQPIHPLLSAVHGVSFHDKSAIRCESQN